MSRKVCKVCGAEFDVRPGNPYGKKFCSIRCRDRYHSINRATQEYKDAHRVTCPYGDLICGAMMCQACGWNPDVAKRRLEKIKEEYGEKIP